jgi:hypothetical protein
MPFNKIFFPFEKLSKRTDRSNDLKSQDLSSFDERPEFEASKIPKILEPEPLKLSSEDIKRKNAKKDEDPQITKFKNAEVKIIKFSF